MSVCEMQRELIRADILVRQAEYDLDIAQFERNGNNGRRPDPPALKPRPGLGAWYCKLLTLVTVKKANAQQPARSPVTRRMSRETASTSVPDDAGYQARIQEAEFRMADARRQRNRYDVEIQKKFALAAACVVFVLVGAPVALRFPRGGVGLVIGVSFAIFGLYYVGLIGGETLADKGYLPPWFAMWIANIVLFILGLVLASRMGRESATTRGGDFGELLVIARARVFGWMRRIGVPVERRRR
jgi:hypothetical protein